MRERRAFKLAKDPHQCKFGLWYDQFKGKGRMLEMTLPGMDAPHKAIHATAEAALQKAEAGDYDGALAMIAAQRSRELAALISLFEESEAILLERNRELAIVLALGAKRLAVSVDQVEAVEAIPAQNIEPMSPLLSALRGGFHWRLGQRLKTHQTVLVLEEDFLSG
ncbi:MAG: CZB domain-containing protein [Verrucomicrobia bacterium]|nr:CZB domain-containing protein [Verrucomicrobiota bacterium]